MEHDDRVNLFTHDFVWHVYPKGYKIQTIPSRTLQLSDGQAIYINETSYVSPSEENAEMAPVPKSSLREYFRKKRLFEAFADIDSESEQSLLDFVNYFGPLEDEMRTPSSAEQHASRLNNIQAFSMAYVLEKVRAGQETPSVEDIVQTAVRQHLLGPYYQIEEKFSAFNDVEKMKAEARDLKAALTLWDQLSNPSKHRETIKGLFPERNQTGEPLRYSFSLGTRTLKGRVGREFIIREGEAIPPVVVDNVWNSVNAPEQEEFGLSDLKNYIRAAKVVLLDFLQTRLKQYPTTVRMAIGEAHIPEIRLEPMTLIGAIWLQFAQHISGWLQAGVDEQPLTCVICGIRELYRKPDWQKTEDGYAHKSCAHARNQKRYRERQAEKEGRSLRKNRGQPRVTYRREKK